MKISPSEAKVWTILASILVFGVFAPVVVAASPFEQSRTLPTIDCGEYSSKCEARLSQENDLYVLASSASAPSLVLYVSRYNQQSYSQYDLSDYSTWLMGQIEFIPFSEYNAVLFFSTSPSRLTRLDLVTGEVIEFTQTGDVGRLIACNDWGAVRGGHHQISRLGTGGQFIFCSLNEAHTKVLVNVGDIVAQTTLHSYDFNFEWTGPGIFPFWRILIGGDDGNIYIDVPGTDPRLIWQEIAGAALPPLDFWGWRLFRFETATEEWTVRNVSPEDMESDNFPRHGAIVGISRLAAVMQNGDIIYRHQWQTVNENPLSGSALEVSRYDANFELLARIDSEVLENSQWNYIGASRDAHVLLIDPSDYAESIEMRLNIPPIAVAGDDHIVTDANNSGSESFTLHGETSSDADGTIESYTWTEVIGGNITQIATGVTPSVNLAVGTHTITLTVTDSDGATDTDEVVAKVNAPPVANAGSDLTVQDYTNDGEEVIYLSGAGSSDSDGAIVSYVWKENGVTIASGISQSINLTTGVHTIVLTVTDTDGATGEDIVIITVSPVSYVVMQCQSGPSPHNICLADSWSTVVTSGQSPNIGPENMLSYSYKMSGSLESGVNLYDTDDWSYVGGVGTSGGTVTYTEPSISPDGLKVAYVFRASTTSKYVIRTADIDGSNVQTLTATTRNSRRPQWSPNGTQIVFYADNGGDNEIYSMNANGSGITALTTNAFNDIDPDWSSDNQIVFSSNRDGNQEIYRMNANGSSVVRLTNNPVADVEPVWSPDGVFVAFASNRTSANSTTTGMLYQIFTLDSSDGSGVTQVSWPTFPETHRYPSWGFINPPLPGCAPGTCLMGPEDPPEE